MTWRNPMLGILLALLLIAAGAGCTIYSAKRENTTLILVIGLQLMAGATILLSWNLELLTGRQKTTSDRRRGFQVMGRDDFSDRS